MSYYEELYKEVSNQLADAHQTIGAYKFRVYHLMEALEQIAECNDLTTAKAIAQVRIELCANWKSDLGILK